MLLAVLAWAVIIVSVFNESEIGLVIAFVVSAVRNHLGVREYGLRMGIRWPLVEKRRGPRASLRDAIRSIERADVVFRSQLGASVTLLGSGRFLASCYEITPDGRIDSLSNSLLQYKWHEYAVVHLG